MMKAASCTMLLAGLLLSGCATSPDNRVLNGAVIGGATGAVIGGVATNTPGGAVVGGVVGATTGAVIADATRPHYSCHWSDRLGRRVCHRI